MSAVPPPAQGGKRRRPRTRCKQDSTLALPRVDSAIPTRKTEPVDPMVICVVTLPEGLDYAEVPFRNSNALGSVLAEVLPTNNRFLQATFGNRTAN